MLQPDALLGPYRLIERIGAGGMGEVWKAEDTRLGRTVAIKVLPSSVAADAKATARLKREARTAAQIYHPNIATIHSIEQDDGRLFIVMELVEGEPLTNVIRRGAMAEGDIRRIGRGYQTAEELCDALEQATTAPYTVATPAPPKPSRRLGMVVVFAPFVLLAVLVAWYARPTPAPVIEVQAPRDPDLEAQAQFRRGQIALFNRNFPVAREQLGKALDAGELDEREVSLARLGIAVASFDRPEAERLAREHRARWPADPDLLRIERAFDGERPLRRPF